ncbi:MAG: hypothetical protein ABJM43_20765 [Paracoccaceae bacterium]
MASYPLPKTTNSILAQAAASGVFDRRVMHSDGREETLTYVLQCIDTSVMARHLTLSIDDKHSFSFVAAARNLKCVTDASFATFNDLINVPFKSSETGDLERLCEMLTTFSERGGVVRIQTKALDYTIDPAQTGFTARQLADCLNVFPEQDLVFDKNAKFERLLVDARDYILAVRRTDEDWQVLHEGLEGLGPITYSADELVRNPNRLSKIMKSEDSLFLGVNDDADLAIGIFLLENGPAALLVSSDATTSLAEIWSS